MSVMTEYGSRPEDVGEILVKVHDDLQSLKQKLITHGDDGTIDISALEKAIAKTEDGLRYKTEQVLQTLNNQVRTIPIGGGGGMGGQVSAPAAPYDIMSGNTGGKLGLRRSMSHQQQHKESGPIGRIPETKLGSELQMAGPTPGQAEKGIYHMRVLANPTNVKNRELMNENYGIQLPLINERKPIQIPLKPTTGSTVDHLAILPRANRVDPQLLPPPITEEDAQKGILSLIERGLIPPAAELHLDPSPVGHKTAPIYNYEDKREHKIHGIKDVHLAQVKLDPCAIPEPPAPTHKVHSASKAQSLPSAGSRISSVASLKKSKPRHLSVRTLEMPKQPMSRESTIPPPTTPASAADLKDKAHRFAIQHGRVRDQSSEYLGFKQHYCLSWGSIVTMLKHLEKMCTNFAVPVAFINGDKLADLSLEFELEKAPTIDDLLSVVVNREDVENLIQRPGRRFMGPLGDNIAAAKIQATWKMYRERIGYLEYRRKKWAAGVIAISWVMHVKMSKVRKNLKNSRLDNVSSYRRRMKDLGRNWDRIQKSKRVIIHIPSAGYSHNIRQSLDDFAIWQNTQMARICDIKDPNVDVIYVAPVPINEEMAQYYSKLLGLKAAIDSGNVDDQADFTERYKIITPEAVKSFPSHRMCLSTQLKYSPKTIKRIQNLIRGREAYIVTGVPHSDDLYISEQLNCPVLCSEPEIASLYSTKSGNKRIFTSANVAVPPGEYDIYSLNQLHECLAQLITENLEVTRWLFKLDDEFNGRGIAYVDVAENLPCYQWAVKEAQRYGEKWVKKWAQEAAYIKIHQEVPMLLENAATPCNTSAYKNWDVFLGSFLGLGGVIEASPPSDSVTSLTVDMMVEPNGRIKILSNGDQIHAETPFTCWGLSVPQSSVEPEDLNDACMKVADSCKARGVIGHFTVDFVTFIHPKSMRQELWAVDLDIAYSETSAMFSLMQFTTGGTFNPKTHYFDIPPPVKDEKKSRRRKVVKEEEPQNLNRYAVMSTKLKHSNLSVVHYSVFFQMCRAHGIGYDVKEKQGTVFTLVDSADRETLGMLSVGDNLQGALATFARNLSVIHQEISAPNMQGNSNFRPVIEDIEAILGTTIQNTEDPETETNESTQG